MHEYEDNVQWNYCTMNADGCSLFSYRLHHHVTMNGICSHSVRFLFVELSKWKFSHNIHTYSFSLDFISSIIFPLYVHFSSSAFLYCQIINKSWWEIMNKGRCFKIVPFSRKIANNNTISFIQWNKNVRLKCILKIRKRQKKEITSPLFISYLTWNLRLTPTRKSQLSNHEIAFKNYLQINILIQVSHRAWIRWKSVIFQFEWTEPHHVMRWPKNRQTCPNVNRIWLTVSYYSCCCWCCCCGANECLIPDHLFWIWFFFRPFFINSCLFHQMHFFS